MEGGDHINGVVITDDGRKLRQAASIPGSWYEPTLRARMFDPARDYAATRVALKMFPDLRMRIDTDILDAAERMPDIRPYDFATAWAGDKSVEELLPNVPTEMRDRLYRYQAVDVAYACARIREDGGAYLGWDRGLGKSFGAVACAFELQADRIVIVAPNSAKDAVWVPEFEKWDSEGRFTDRVFNLRGTKKQRERVFEWWRREGGVLLAHYEVLRLVEKWPEVDLVIVDESHRLASGGPGHKVPAFYKALKKVKSKGRLALSGSVITNSPEDFFGALHWLFPDRYKSRWRDWNNRYLSYVESAFGRVLSGVKEDALDQMKRELAAFLSIRKKQDELPDLPDRIDQTLHVDLTPEQRRVYNEFAANFIASLPDGEIIKSPSVLSQLTKLRQISTGLDLFGEGLSDSSKIDLAVELVKDNLPSKTVVFTWHRATATALAARLEGLGIESHVITGDVPPQDRAEAIKDFQHEAGRPVIVATIKTLGESVTLHSAADVVFVESSWTPTDMEQAADRVYRIGQTRRVTVTRIVARDTVDEWRVVPALENKAAMRRMILGE